MYFRRQKLLLWSKGLFIMDFQFVCFDALCPSQQFLIHVGTISRLPGLN